MATVAMYTVDGDEFDAQDHPNVFFLPRDVGDSLSLAQLREHFPLQGHFHFRYQVPGCRHRVWRDLRRDEDEAPINEHKKIFLRVLRLRAEGDDTCEPEPSAPPTSASASASEATPAVEQQPPPLEKIETRERGNTNTVPDDFFEMASPQASNEDVASPSPGGVASPSSAFTPQEQQMESAKAAGNKSFKIGQFPDAVAEYTKAVEIWDALEEKTAAADKFVCDCLNNRAACRIQTRDFDEAIEDASRVLTLQPKNGKAFLRRGTCYEHIEKYRKSETDMESVLSIDPGSKQAKDVLNRVKKVMKSLGL